VFTQNKEVIAIKQGIFGDRFHALPPLLYYFQGSIAEIDNIHYRHSWQSAYCREK
jgi:hypothetical protein